MIFRHCFLRSILGVSVLSLAAFSSALSSGLLITAMDLQDSAPRSLDDVAAIAKRIKIAGDTPSANPESLAVFAELGEDLNNLGGAYSILLKASRIKPEPSASPAPGASTPPVDKPDPRVEKSKTIAVALVEALNKLPEGYTKFYGGLGTAVDVLKLSPLDLNPVSGATLAAKLDASSAAIGTLASDQLPAVQKGLNAAALLVNLKVKVDGKDTDFYESLIDLAGGTGTTPQYSKAKKANDAFVEAFRGFATFSHLDAQLKSLASHIEIRIRIAEENAVTVASQPHILGPKAKQLRDSDQPVLNSITSLTGKIPALVKAFHPQGASLNPSLARLQKSLAPYEVALAGLDLAIKGNRDSHIGKQISLYYFRDAQRLINILHPGKEGKKLDEVVFTDRATQLQQLRKDIVTNDFDLEAEFANLGEAQQKQLRLVQGLASAKETLKKAQTDYDSIRTKVQEQKKLLADIEGKLKVADNEIALAKAELERINADPVATEPDKAAARLRNEQANNTKARTLSSKDVANQDLLNLQEDEGLKKKDLEDAQAAVKAIEDGVKDAKSAARNAAIAIATTRKKGALSVQDEAADFINQRDNAPMLVAHGDPLSQDPTLRVTLAGFKDASTIFVRGSNKDVALVENIIAQFDRPAPQAKITLWTLQVNVVQDDSGIRNINDAMRVMERDLTNARLRSSAAGSLLRDCLIDKVNEVINCNMRLYSGPQADRLAALHFYEPLLTGHMGFTPAITLQPRCEEQESFVLRNLPDPTKPTTLGEAMLIFVMGRRSYQEEIICKWKAKVMAYMDQARDFKEDLKRLPKEDQERVRKGMIFPATMRAFGLDGFGATQAGMTPIQTEILCAIQRKAVENMIGEIFAKERLEIKTPGVCKALEIRYKFLEDEIHLSPEQIKEVFKKGEAGYQELLLQFPLSAVNARIAAVDDMLKKLIVAVDEDVEDLIIRPAVYGIRDKLKRYHVNVGTLQRTSVLATNRFVARVDAGASAQVAMGETQDVLKATQQLAQMALAAESQNPLDVIKGLKSDDKEPPRQIYGITSGGLFKVTPIFDPSGQALRFVFDYVTTNRVRDPNDTTDPALPQIERHTINTEVQLSTFELRTVSSFEVNNKLGLPEHRWGGIPLLNQIPVLKEIPIIGWFVRRTGRAAVTQQNIVLAQTTMYPTIEDMLKLLTPPTSKIDIGGK